MQSVRSKRMFIAVSAGAVATALLRPLPSLAAAPDQLQAAVDAFSKGKKVTAGRVKLDIEPLLENGNSVPITITVASPMTATDFVKSIAVFNEKNPQRDVAIFRFGPVSGSAKITTRIRLATSQKLVAVAEMSDGTFWSHSAEAIVTLAACAEEG